MSNAPQVLGSWLGQPLAYLQQTGQKASQMLTDQFERSPGSTTLGVGMAALYGLPKISPAVGALLGPSAAAVTSLTLWTLATAGSSLFLHGILRKDSEDRLPQGDAPLDKITKYLPRVVDSALLAPFAGYGAYVGAVSNGLSISKSAILAPLFTSFGAGVLGVITAIGMLHLMAKDWNAPAPQGTSYQEKAMVHSSQAGQLIADADEPEDDAVDVGVGRQGLLEINRGIKPEFQQFLDSIDRVEITGPSMDSHSFTVQWASRVTGQIDSLVETFCLVIQSEDYPDVVAHVPANRFGHVTDDLSRVHTQAEIRHLLRECEESENVAEMRSVRLQVVKADEAGQRDALPSLAEEDKDRKKLFACATEAIRCAFCIQGEEGADLDRVNLGNGILAKVNFKPQEA